MLAFTAAASPAALADHGRKGLSCGTTITQSTTLDADVGPCTGNGIILGASNIILNCDGHSVTGKSPSGVGIGTAQSGDAVENCAVRGFGTGFLVYQGSLDTLSNDVATGNKMNGFVILEGVQTSVTDSQAQGNGMAGFVVTFGDGAQFANDEASRTAGEGFTVYFASGNTFTGDRAEGNGQAGFGV